MQEHISIQIDVSLVLRHGRKKAPKDMAILVQNLLDSAFDVLLMALDVPPADSQWLYETFELHDTPSSHDGISWKEEAYERATAVDLLVQLGAKLRV
jgi:hypothetical protein